MHLLFRYLGPELNAGYSFVQLVVRLHPDNHHRVVSLSVAFVSPSCGGGGLGLTVGYRISHFMIKVLTDYKNTLMVLDTELAELAQL